MQDNRVSKGLQEIAEQMDSAGRRVSAEMSACLERLAHRANPVRPVQPDPRVRMALLALRGR